MDYTTYLSMEDQPGRFITTKLPHFHRSKSDLCHLQEVPFGWSKPHDRGDSEEVALPDRGDHGIPSPGGHGISHGTGQLWHEI